MGAVAVVLLAGGTVSVFPGQAGWLWTAGAAGLGLLSGFSTGVSKATGSGKEFVQFIGAGILVPILGGVGAFLNKRQEVTETSTYSGTQLVQKTTTTVASPSESSLHPLAVLGAFFAAFALAAIVGLIGGSLLKKAGAIDAEAAPSK